MVWSHSSNRRASLPPGWSNRVAPTILHRDPHCQLRSPGCTGTSTEVDHIGDRHDHSPPNLRGVCHHCHTKHTAQQATEARAAAAGRRPPNTKARPPESHPGLT